MGRTILSLALAIAVLADPADSEAAPNSLLTASDYFDVLKGWKLSLVGRELNGVALNGQVLDGRVVHHVSLTDIELDGERVRDVRLEASRFSGTVGRSHHVGSRQFIGAIFAGFLDDADPIPLRIDAVERGRGRNLRDVTRYAVSYPTDAGWLPLCGLDDEGVPVMAIPLLGRWDHSQGTATGGARIDDPDVFTFGCRGYVLAHCVEAGYAPWREVEICRSRRDCDTVTLADQHQACTRVLRADYCGDGTPQTVDGVLINVYDRFEIRVDSEDWLLEAEWDADGAICMSEERVAGQAPTCMAALAQPNCGDPAHFSADTLLITEVPPDE